MKQLSICKTQKGFTLIELVMVMVIIGLLAAIIIPKFTSQRDQAAIATTRANLENLRTAISLYYADEATYPDAGLTVANKGLLSSPKGKIYIRDIPKEAIKNLKTVKAGAVDGLGGWTYDAATGDVHPNLTDDAADTVNDRIYSKY